MSETILQDEKELVADSKDEMIATVEVWKRRFKQADEFKRPYNARNLRMYKLYRAYRWWAGNYAYQTNLMPPIGFEVIETVKPRLAAARINTRILPTKKEDIENESLNKWDNLVHYFFDVMNFPDKKTEWIDAQLKYGNGVAQISWDQNKPYLEICDNWLLYIDPQARQRLEGARWIIKRSWKEKEIIEKEEENREEGEKIYDADKLSKLKNEPVTDDPRSDRRDVDVKKMGMIDDATKRDNAEDSGAGESRSPDNEYKAIELWECYDFISQKVITIGNRKEVIREEDNPYKDINKNRNPGNLFIDLPNTSLPWEYNAMPLLEPIESIIYEIADSRNQAMDNIVYNLDPIRKVRKNKGYKEGDFVAQPGALWWLEMADDIVIDRPPDISKAWIEKDEILRREIQTSLALSEYTQGMPKSSQEPMGKVELLLMQTNIRFSILVRNLENAITDLVNIVIELSQEFLDEDIAHRVAGEDFEFSEFKQQDKEVTIDAKVDVIPKKEKSPQQEAMEVKEMYTMFILNQPPDPNNPEEVYNWKKKKAAMEKLILERTGYEEYEDILVDSPTPPQQQQPLAGLPGGESGTPPVMQQESGGLMDPQTSPIQQVVPDDKIPIMPPEQVVMPGATNSMTAPSEGLMQRLMSKILK